MRKIFICPNQWLNAFKIIISIKFFKLLICDNERTSWPSNGAYSSLNSIIIEFIEISCITKHLPIFI